MVSETFVLGKAAKGTKQERLQQNYLAFKKLMMEHLDIDQTFKDFDPESSTYAVDTDKFLRSVFDALRTGEHLRHAGEEATDGVRSLASRISLERILIYKNNVAYHEVNKSIGYGTLRESVKRGLSHAAFNNGLMQTFGPDPARNWKALKDFARHRASKLEGGAQRGTLNERKVDNFFSVIDGSINIPTNALRARIANNVRGWISRTIGCVAKYNRWFEVA